VFPLPLEGVFVGKIAIMAEHNALSPGAKHSAARKDRRRSRTQIYAFEEQDSNIAVFQSHDYLTSRRQDLISKSSPSRDPVSRIKSTRNSVAPTKVARTLSSSSTDPHGLLEYDSGKSDSGNTLQPSLQFEPHSIIGQSVKDCETRQLESIGTNFESSTLKQRPILSRGRRYLKRSYQDMPKKLMATKTLSVNDNAVTADLQFSVDSEGDLELPGSIRQCSGLPDSTDPIAASQIPAVPLIFIVASEHDSPTPFFEVDASYFPVQSYIVRTVEHPVSPTSKRGHQRSSSSGTIVFTPPLITTASPNSEKSGIVHS